MLQTNISSHLYGFTDLKSLNERGPLSFLVDYVYDTKGNKYLDANSGLECFGISSGLIEVAKQHEKFAGYHSLFVVYQRRH